MIVKPAHYFLYLRSSHLRFQALEFGKRSLETVSETSRDHLLIQDLSRLSLGISGFTFLGWKSTAASSVALRQTMGVFRRNCHTPPQLFRNTDF